MAQDAAKLLIVAGLGLVVLGGLLLLGGKVGLGRLPGDLTIKGEHSTIYFPVVTCLVLSALLSLALWLVRAFRG